MNTTHRITLAMCFVNQIVDLGNLYLPGTECINGEGEI